MPSPASKQPFGAGRGRYPNSCDVETNRRRRALTAGDVGGPTTKTSSPPPSCDTHPLRYMHAAVLHPCGLACSAGPWQRRRLRRPVGSGRALDGSKELQLSHNTRPAIVLVLPIAGTVGHSGTSGLEAGQPEDHQEQPDQALDDERCPYTEPRPFSVLRSSSATTPDERRSRSTERTAHGSIDERPGQSAHSDNYANYRSHHCRRRTLYPACPRTPEVRHFTGSSGIDRRKAVECS